MTTLDAATPEQHRQRYLDLRHRALARAATPVAGPPPALPPTLVRHREVIPGGWYWTVALRRGQGLRIVNPSGAAAVSALLWNADETSERYNAGDTLKLQWTARITAGRLLFSDMGRVLASVTADTGAGNDGLTGGSTPDTNARRYGDATLRNTQENFRLAAAKHGLSRRDIPPCITFFAAIGTDEAGRFVWHASSPPGALVDLRAEMNLLVALSNCPHPLDPAPGYAPPLVEAIVWAAPPAAADDACRHASEEAERGFDNTDALFAG